MDLEACSMQYIGKKSTQIFSLDIHRELLCEMRENVVVTKIGINITKENRLPQVLMMYYITSFINGSIDNLACT